MKKGGSKNPSSFSLNHQHVVEFDVDDFVWAMLTKDRFLVGEYKKLATRKIELLEIVEKINPNVYRLKLPSHMRMSNVCQAHGSFKGQFFR